jgi:hypothetical protein
MVEAFSQKDFPVGRVLTVKISDILVRKIFGFLYSKIDHRIVDPFHLDQEDDSPDKDGKNAPAEEEALDQFSAYVVQHGETILCVLITDSLSVTLIITQPGKF